MHGEVCTAGVCVCVWQVVVWMFFKAKFLLLDAENCSVAQRLGIVQRQHVEIALEMVFSSACEKCGASFSG